MDSTLRKRQRRGEVTWRDLARLGLCAVRLWDGNGHGYGRGCGNGYGNGNGNGDGHGYGNGKQKEEAMDYTAFIGVGTPVVVRSYTTGVVVGRLAGGEGGAVALTAWRWLREWRDVGGAGSVYDLVSSGVTPQERGPLTESATVLQQADVFAIDEAAYERLAL